jgi:hypothetical protein
MDINTTSTLPFFLENFLSKPATALPKGAQWLLMFDSFPVEAIKKGLAYESQKWQVDRAIGVITMGDDFLYKKGCLFVQAVQIPGESFTVNPEGLQQNGYLRTNIGAGRDAYNGIQVVFLDTNVSFVDNLIRPWVIATSHLGLIARSGSDNYRTTMSVFKLGVQNPSEPPYVAQKYTFYGVCPISVTGEEYSYSPVTSPTNRETTFLFHSYTIDTSTNQAAIKNIPPVQDTTREIVMLPSSVKLKRPLP